MTTIKAILLVALLGWVTGCAGAMQGFAAGYSAGVYQQPAYQPAQMYTYQQQVVCRTVYQGRYATTVCR